MLAFAVTRAIHLGSDHSHAADWDLQDHASHELTTCIYLKKY